MSIDDSLDVSINMSTSNNTEAEGSLCNFSLLTDDIIIACCIVEKSKDILAGLKLDLNRILSLFSEDQAAGVMEDLKNITVDLLVKALNKNGVNFGIDLNALARIVERASYESASLVARGKTQTDGVDGHVIEHFSRERDVKPQLLDNGDIDHKELGLILDIEKGTIIADIIKEVPPVSGTGVSGNELIGRPGKPPVIPQGANTSISADGTHLIANVSGNLVFKQGKFCVEQLVVINGNLDSAIGNIEFSGDVEVKGDVFFGYTINSKKSVKISGSVEGANIYAGGDITVGYGINGQQKGFISAKGDVKAMFIENCELYAEGNVSSQVIINSHVSSEKEINVTTGKGVISGGEIIAVKRIAANTVGSEVNIPTTLRLGMTQKLTQNIHELENSIAEIEEEMDLIGKNITYLELLEQQNQISADRKELLVKLKAKKPTMLMILKRLKTDLTLKTESCNAFEFCSVNINRSLYPPVKVHFGNTINKNIDNNYGTSTITYRDGDIHIG